LPYEGVYHADHAYASLLTDLGLVAWIIVAKPLSQKGTISSAWLVGGGQCKSPFDYFNHFTSISSGKTGAKVGVVKRLCWAEPCAIEWSLASFISSVFSILLYCALPSLQHQRLGNLTPANLNPNCTN